MRRVVIAVVCAGIAFVAALFVYNRRIESELRSQLYIPKKERITPEIRLLQDYVRIDTVTGDETPGARFLAALLEKNGVKAEVIESAPGRGNVYARLKGRRSGEGLLLLNHIDVMPAPPEGWRKPPFRADIVFNQMWGRGTLDMKSIALCELEGFLAVARCELPTIAAVGGAAVGAGLNLALATDVRLAGPRAKFVARFLDLGLHPGGGMTWLLQRIVGPQTAMAMTVFGQMLDGREAERTGLAFQMVDGDHDALVTAAVALAAPAAAAPRELVIETKRSMRTTASLNEHAAAVEVELVAQLESMKTPAFTELLARMREKISKRTRGHRAPEPSSEGHN